MAPISSRQRSHEEFLLRWPQILLLVAVAVAPLPLGSARPIAWSVLAAGIGLPAAAAAVALYGGVPRLRLKWDAAAAALLFVAVLGWAAFQLAPVSPEAWHHPAWTVAAEALGRSLSGAIALDPGAGLDALIRLATYGAAAGLAFLAAQSHAAATRTVVAVALAATAQSSLALVLFLGGNGTLLWQPKTAYLDDLTGTFVYRNAFAVYADLGFVAALGLALDRLLAAVDLRRSWREVLQRALDHVSTRAAWPIAASALLAITVLLSHSRAGFAALLAGVAALLACIAAAQSLRGPRPATVALATLGIALPLVLALGPSLLRRYIELGSADWRPAIWRGAVALWTERPWLGIGLGGFRDAFAPLRPEPLTAGIDVAHSDIIELAVELGLPAAAAFVAAQALLLRRCLHGVRNRRRGAILPCIGVAATVVVGLDATVDFAAQIPAVALTYAVLLGTAAAQSYRFNDPGRNARNRLSN